MAVGACLLPAFVTSGMTPLLVTESTVGGAVELRHVGGVGVVVVLAVAAWLARVSSRRIRKDAASSAASPQAIAPPPPSPVAPAPSPVAAPPSAAVAANLLSRALSVRLPPEPQCGCIEYKRKFACAKADARFGELIAQMVWRINEGDGICM